MNSNKKILILILIFVVILIAIFLFTKSDNIEILWEKNFGGKYNQDGWCVLPTKDGCITVGYTESNKNRDIYLLRVNQKGEEIWNETYGGKGIDTAKAIHKTKSDEFIIVGSTDSFGRKNSNIWVLKIDGNGTEIWNETYGGDGWDEGNAIISKDNENFIIVGSTTSYGNGEDDLYLIKIDTNGTLFWNITYGGKKEDIGRSIDVSEKGYVIGGITSSFGLGGDDTWLIKINETGHIQGNFTYGTSYNERCNQIISTSDGGYVLVGHKIKNDNRWNAYILKINKNGVKEWEKTIQKEKETGFSSCEEISKGYIVSGHIGKYGKKQDSMILIFDKSGNIITEKIISKEYGNAGVWIKKTDDSNCYITGYHEKKEEEYDIWLAKIKIK